MRLACWCLLAPPDRGPVTSESSTLRSWTRGRTAGPAGVCWTPSSSPPRRALGSRLAGAGGWQVSHFPRCHSLTWFWFFQEELADGAGHGLCRLHGRPVPAAQLRGHLQPLQAAAVPADEGPPPGRRGGHHGRDLGPGARWVLGAVLSGVEGGLAGGAARRHGDRAQVHVGGALGTWEQGLSLCSVQCLKTRASVHTQSLSLSVGAKAREEDCGPWRCMSTQRAALHSSMVVEIGLFM